MSRCEHTTFHLCLHHEFEKGRGFSASIMPSMQIDRAVEVEIGGKNSSTVIYLVQLALFSLFWGWFFWRRRAIQRRGRAMQKRRSYREFSSP